MTRHIFFLIFIVLFVNGSNDHYWINEKHKQFTLRFSSADKIYRKAYLRLFENGIKQTKKFFNQSYPKHFFVVVHPNRQSLDSTWQKDWSMPEFKSECWMVASGISTKMDIISPRKWDEESCEHKFRDEAKTQELVTHEMIHVFHGQHNVSPDFSNTESIDWFIEGLATYASGQCDSTRISQIKQALTNNNIPSTLDKFWSGKLKYGLSGSVVMYIDRTYGKKKLFSLLRYNKKAEILSDLETSEEKLIQDWKKFLTSL